MSLLDKGLTYIPTYKMLPKNDIYEAQHRLIRSIKLRDYFEEKETNDYDFNVKTFTNKSNWTPADHLLCQSTLDTVQEIINTTESVIRNRKIINNNQILLRHFEDNLTPAEREALEQLKSNINIIIKPADKGSATVIMDKTAYVAEAHRQLKNAKYYRKLDRPTYTNNVKPINDILEEMAALQVISDKQLTFLRANDSDRQRIFYLLPKIHKPRDKWPQANRMPEGRPIVSDCGSESYRVSQYIDSFIRPISIKHPSYIKDTYDFVSKIRNQHIPSDAFLVTGDVCALYTNMHIDRTIETVREALRKHPVDGRPDQHIIRLLEITLRNNDFVFDKECFLQICGTAMGKTYAPALADLYLEHFDEVASNNFYIRPQLYFRFLDDTFFVWTGSLEQLREYEIFLNQIIPGIVITLNVSPISVNFLDTTVYKKNLNLNKSTLLTKVYFKETDTHQLLHQDSFHPKHTTRGVLKSQILRFQRISSTYEDFTSACNILFKSLAKRRYPSRLMRKMKVDIWRKSQSGPSTAITVIDEEPNAPILPVVVPFNEVGTELAKRWRQTIEKNEMYQQYRLITAYKTGRNLRKNLVKSLLNENNMKKRLGFVVQPTKFGTTRCTSTKCRACAYIKPCSTIRSHTNCKDFKTIGNINCKTNNIIYLISCNLCNQQYVGETSRPLADRVNTHLSCIRTNKDTPVGLHFNMADHSLSHFAITGIERMDITSNNITRKMKESTWQNLLQTAYPLGINNLKKQYL
jgi:hypothetical protein